MFGALLLREWESEPDIPTGTWPAPAAAVAMFWAARAGCPTSLAEQCFRWTALPFSSLR
jgi:hypothetical protein